LAGARLNFIGEQESREDRTFMSVNSFACMLKTSSGDVRRHEIGRNWMR